MQLLAGTRGVECFKVTKTVKKGFSQANLACLASVGRCFGVLSVLKPLKHQSLQTPPLNSLEPELVFTVLGQLLKAQTRSSSPFQTFGLKLVQTQNLNMGLCEKCAIWVQTPNRVMFDGRNKK